jgi:hypothetical protein
MNDPSTDADLRARLGAADPARGLSPADPNEVDRLVRRVVDSDLRETGTRRRSALTWFVAAAAVVVIAAGAVLWVKESDRGHTDGGLLADPSATTSAPAPGSTTELTAAGHDAGRCIVPTPALLAAKPIAFEGTVVGIADGVATIRPTTVYAGEVGAEVTVTGAVAPDTGVAVEGDPEFVAGEDYLVAADGGRVLGCGLSGPITPELRDLYTRAFEQ